MSIKNKIYNLLISIISEPKKSVFVTVKKVSYNAMMKGKVVLVVGGARGIGYAIAERLVEEGASVIITGRSKETLEQAVNQLGSCSSFIEYDNEKIEGRAQFLNKCYEIKGRIDCFVLNAGISLHESTFMDVDTLGFEKQFKINFESTYFLIQEIIKCCLTKNEPADILVVSSETSAKYNDLPYGLSKVAINSMVGGIARRLSHKSIRLNAIAPGVTLTDMTSTKNAKNDLYNNSAGERYILPEEIANVAVFLLSEAASCINGETVFCDCGNHLKINGLDSNYTI